MSTQNTPLSLAGYALGVVLVCGLVVLCGLFAWAAWLYPWPAMGVLGMVALLTLLHRWREPSIEIDVADELLPRR